MLDDLTAAALLTARREDFSRAARTARLARLASPPRSPFRASGLVHWLRGGQLGIGYVDQPTRPLTARCVSC